MGTVRGKVARKMLEDGTVLESHDRYYRYNAVKSEVEYSDYTADNWRTSVLTLEEFPSGNGVYNVC